MPHPVNVAATDTDKTLCMDAIDDRGAPTDTSMTLCATGNPSESGSSVKLEQLAEKRKAGCYGICFV